MMVTGVADPQAGRALRLRRMIATVAAARNKLNTQLTSEEDAPPKLFSPPPELKLEPE
jgi:hypothetical protein